MLFWFSIIDAAFSHSIATGNQENTAAIDVFRREFYFPFLDLQLKVIWSENFYWCKWIALLNDKECRLPFCDTLFYFSIIHYFVWLADDVILFAKGKENVRGSLCFLKEIDSKNISYFGIPF